MKKNKMVVKKLSTIFIFLFILNTPTLIYASKKEITAVMAKEKPVIDGEIENVWLDGQIKGDFTSLITGEHSKEQTKTYLLWDEDYLYVAFESEIKDPKDLKAVSKVRDDDNFRFDDVIKILIDTFGDGRGYYVFEVNPLGTQLDYSTRDTDWNVDWESKSKVQANKWTVEIAIPFKVLRYHAKEEQKWGINFARVNRKLSEKSVLFYSGKNFSEDPLYFPELKGIKIKGGTPLRKFIGYGVFQDRRNEAKKLNVGIDVSYPFTPSLTGNLAVLPDFSEVEVDELITTPQQFAVFFQERRPFFKEGSSFFTNQSNFDLPGGFRIFHSRRINRFNYGGKLSGKISDYSIGLLQTHFTNEKNRVIKVKKDFGKKGSIGIINVEKEKDNISSSSLDYAADINFSKNFQFVFERAESFAGTTKNNSALQSALIYNDDENQFTAGYLDTEKNFNPPNAFFQMTDIKGPFLFLNRFKKYEKGKLKGFFGSIFLEDLRRHDNSKFFNAIDFNVSFLTRKDIEYDYSYNESELTGKKSSGHSFLVKFNAEDWRSTRFSYDFGKFEDLPSHTFTFSKAFLGAKNLKTYYNFEVSKFTRDGTLTKNLFHRLNFVYELDPKTTLSTNLRMDKEGDLNLFLVYRKRINIDSDLYIVLGDPNSKKSTERIVIKHTFPLF